jgi:hypothetical protein
MGNDDVCSTENYERVRRRVKIRSSPSPIEPKILKNEGKYLRVVSSEVGDSLVEVTENAREHACSLAPLFLLSSPSPESSPT